MYFIALLIVSGMKMGADCIDHGLHKQNERTLFQSLMDLSQRFRYELSTFYRDIHPLTRQFWLMESSTVVATCAFYLLTVGTLSMWMRKRDPIPQNIIKPVLLPYNLVQILINSVIFFISLTSILTRSTFENLLCLPLPPHDMTTSQHPQLDMWEAFGNWLFFMNKFVELLDTVWIVLRKRFRQLSFLHVYHHSTVLLVFWVQTYFLPGGVCTWNSVLNSGVHVLMYSYYLMGSLGLSQYALSFKRRVTQIQICQFVMLLTLSSCACYHIHVTRTCRHSVLYGLGMNMYGLSLLALFFYFYFTTYQKTKQDLIKKVY